MRGLAIALLVLAVSAALGSCQMFQYSRGWKPGKRAEAPPSILEQREGGGPGSAMFSLVVRCLQAINAWESLHAGGEAEEVGRVASHFLDVLERCQLKEAY